MKGGCNDVVVRERERERERERDKKTKRMTVYLTFKGKFL